MTQRLRGFWRFIRSGPFGGHYSNGSQHSNDQYRQLDFDWHTLQAAGMDTEE